MRKIAFSSKVWSRMWLRSCAEARSRPKGFSMMTRAPCECSPPGTAAPPPCRRPPAGWPGNSAGRCARAQFLAQRLERGRVVVIAVHVAQQAAQLVKRRRIESAVFLQAVLRPGLELVQVPARLGHADDRHVEIAAFHHRLQRREDLLVGQVAGGPEEDQRVGMGCVHDAFYLPAFSRCPPKPKRMAESSLSW